MNKLKEIVLAGLVALVLGGCAAMPRENSKDAAWKPGVTETETGYYAIGCSKGMHVGLARNLAEDKARHELARYFSTSNPYAIQIKSSRVAEYHTNSDGQTCAKVEIEK